MAINISQAFHRTSANAVDETLTLTKAQMLAVNDNLMPSKYFTICQEDGAIYLYDKSATPNAETGKFTKFEGGTDGISISQEDFNNLPQSEKDNGTSYFIYDGDELTQKAVMGYTPIGTVISVMGNSAPRHYLACDGQIVNIIDYPELAVYFEQQFGSKNHFGGDGTTTFAVPDLRGEFLRGTGIRTNGKGSGANVGNHQDGTELPYEGLTIGSSLTKSRWKRFDDSWKTVDGNYTNGYKNMDYHYGNDNKKVFNLSSSATVGDTTNEYISIGIRPTNTSVLYCIATKNIYTNPENIYSTEESVVGQWIDGKPIYQKTITGTTVSASSDTLSNHINVSSLNIDNMISIEGYFISRNDNGVYRPVNMVQETQGSSYCVLVDFDKTAGYLREAVSPASNTSKPEVITIQYTKTTD